MLTYPREDLERAKALGQITPAGVAYAVHVAGPKTAGVTLLKEAHHTSQNISDSRKWAQQKWRLVEVSTRMPEST